MEIIQYKNTIMMVNKNKCEKFSHMFGGVTFLSNVIMVLFGSPGKWEWEEEYFYCLTLAFLLAWLMPACLQASLLELFSSLFWTWTGWAASLSLSLCLSLHALLPIDYPRQQAGHGGPSIISVSIQIPSLK